MALPDSLRELLGLAAPCSVPWEEVERQDCGTYERSLIRYQGDEDDQIGAYLLMPKRAQRAPGVVVFHQHNGEWHLGKSEVVGLAGDPLQGFGPALAARGIVVLAPDAITFEDRRRTTTGIQPASDDWQQHYNEMAYRLVVGDSLMRKMMDDATRALSVLREQSQVNPQRVGTTGHSFGGTTALYHALLDSRVRFACCSGCVCSLATRMRRGTGIGMIEVVPGLANRWEMSDVLAAIAADLLVVSSTEDPYSIDADKVVESIASASDPFPGRTKIRHLRFGGGHGLTEERFQAIVEWIAGRALQA